MSMPFNTIQCSNCDYSSWLLDRNGWKYYQLPDNKKLTVNSAWGWCYDCKELKAIEYLPTRQSIDTQLHRDETVLSEIKKTGLTRKLFQILGKDGFEIEQINDRIQKGKKWLVFLDQRNSTPRCLTCSSTRIKSLDLPETEEYKGFMLNGFKHPGCGGALWLRQHEIRLNAIYTPKCYDTEGCFIKDEVVA